MQPREVRDADQDHSLPRNLDPRVGTRDGSFQTQEKVYPGRTFHDNKHETLILRDFSVRIYLNETLEVESERTSSLLFKISRTLIPKPLANFKPFSGINLTSQYRKLDITDSD